MKKKVNVFGKSVPVLVIALMSLALVSAALVPYISNTITGLITVSHPLELKISNDNSNWVDGSVTILSVVGGETFTYWQQVENNGEIEVITDMTTVITNTENDVTCADFTEMLVTVTRNTHDSNEEGVVQDVLDLGLCSETAGVATVTIPSNYQSPEIEEYRLDVTFALNVKPDTYTIDTTAMI